ncbi:MAG: IS982 family transposase [Dysgonamonadaceae bacterium]|jgi:hypothetical protein|nr:IS982 family transposase [Dysgonamonadaceae bacterium]
MSDAEIITVMICFHCDSFRNLKHFYLFYVAKHLQSEFPNLLFYNRFVDLERKVMIPFALFLKLICFGGCTGIAFIDSSKMAVCKNKRIRRNRVFKDMATVGKSTTGWFYGFKLHLVVNDRGELLNFCITPANVDDRNWSVIQPLWKKSRLNFCASPCEKFVLKLLNFLRRTQVKNKDDSGVFLFKNCVPFEFPKPNIPVFVIYFIFLLIFALH